MISGNLVNDFYIALRHAFGGSYNEYDMEDFFSDTRFPLIVRARESVANELRTKGYSYPKIGSVMRRPHSTVIYYVRRAHAHAGN